MRSELAIVVAFGVAVGSFAGRARAQPSSEAPPAPVRLEWAADEPSCPPLELVRSQVQGVLGRDPFAAAADAAPPYVVSVRISAASAGWSALLELRDASGAVLGGRTVHARARRCASLAESLGLVLAMVIDLSRRHAELTLPESPPAPVVSPPRVEPLPSSVARARHRVGVAVRTGPGVAIGLLAPVTLGYHLALIVTPTPALGVRFSLDAFPSDFAYDAGAAVELRAATGSFDACLRFADVGVLSLSVCAGGVVGAAVGTGQNLDVTRTEGGPIAGAEGSLVVRLAAGAEGFAELDASVIGWMTRQDFGYLDSGVARMLREMPPVTALVRLSLGWRLVP